MGGGFRLLGFVSGAIFGAIGSLVVATLFSGVLMLEGPGDFLVLAGVCALIGGTAGASLLGRRGADDPDGGPTFARSATLIVIPLLILLACIMLLMWK